MLRDQYLKNKEVEIFIKYFKHIIAGGEGSFIQKYIPKKNKSAAYSIQNFQGAYLNYTWAGNTLSETEEDLSKISLKDHNGDVFSDDQNCLIRALKILNWGGVVNGPSVMWLVKACEAGNLREKLLDASKILEGDDDSLVKRFSNNEDLRSDSATTKLFSEISEHSIIYDDRVGAAIASIVKNYLLNANYQRIPETLQFMRGNQKSRNPSTTEFRFPRKITGEDHALSNLRMNWITYEIACDNKLFSGWGIKENTVTKRMRAIEAALFMIGYDINGDASPQINL